MNRYLILILLTSVVCAQDTTPLTLKTCIEAARRTNPDLAVTRANTAEAKSSIRVAGTELGPTLGMSASSRVVSVVPEMVQSARDITTPLGSFTIPGGTQQMGDYDSHSIDLEIRQLLYAGGRLHGTVRLSESIAATAELQELTARHALDGDVAATFLSLLRTSEIRTIANLILNTARIHAGDVHNRVEAGVLTSSETLKANLRVTEADAALINADNQIRLLINRLRHLTGLNIDESVVPAPPDCIIPASQDVASDLLTAMSLRSEFQVIDAQIESARRERDLIAREYRPTISGFAKASYGKPGPDFIKNEWIDSYSAGLNISWNAWDNGRVNAKTVRIDARIRRIEAQRAAIEATLTQAVEAAAIGIDDVRARLTVTERAVVQAEEQFRITADRFHEGTLTNTDYLDADSALSRERINLIIARNDLHLAWIRHQLAIGRDLLEEK